MKSLIQEQSPPSPAAQFPSLDGATAWINSQPLEPANLRGKVVIVNFWTYTCINWLHTLPYVRAWADKYRDHGLVVIGVHSPEFGFEGSLANVRREVQSMNIKYPVAVDSDHAIWRAFDNEYWPALYLIDAQGNIPFHHFGEGGYEKTERMIQQLLVQAGNADVPRDLVSVTGVGAELAPDSDALRSNENYLGYERTAQFVSTGTFEADKFHTFVASARIELNQWNLSGSWAIRREKIELNERGGKITYRFHARDLHLVMGAMIPGTNVRFRVLIDGKPPGTSHGSDSDAEGYGTLSDSRLYQLIRQQPPILDRTFEIEFFGSGVEAFAFTFG